MPGQVGLPGCQVGGCIRLDYMAGSALLEVELELKMRLSLAETETQGCHLKLSGSLQIHEKITRLILIKSQPKKVVVVIVVVFVVGGGGGGATAVVVDFAVVVNVDPKNLPLKYGQNEVIIR